MSPQAVSPAAHPRRGGVSWCRAGCSSLAIARALRAVRPGADRRLRRPGGGRHLDRRRRHRPQSRSPGRSRRWPRSGRRSADAGPEGKARQRCGRCRSPGSSQAVEAGVATGHAAAAERRLSRRPRADRRTCSSIPTGTTSCSPAPPTRRRSIQPATSSAAHERPAAAPTRGSRRRPAGHRRGPGRRHDAARSIRSPEGVTKLQTIPRQPEEHRPPIRGHARTMEEALGPQQVTVGACRPTAGSPACSSRPTTA